MATRELYAGAQDPIWFGDRKVYTVTGFVIGVRSRVVDLPSFWVLGEVSDFKHLAHLSMVYFTLKDPENGYTLRCTMGRTQFEALGVDVTDGDRVQVFGRADIYAPHGAFQMRVRSVEHEGRGLLMQQLEALKAKLAAEGLFDDGRKRALPFLPRRVGVITGADAAAQGDFLRNVRERFPPVKLCMIETLVQGDRAAPLLVAALRKMQRVQDVDVIVITRGGGAFEHFLPFCDERLCRAIADCRVPVVSAIGHEKDNPISDFVADLRVSTPTAAARTVVPDYAHLVAQLQRNHAGGRRRVHERLERREERVASLRARLSNRSPAKVVEERVRFVAQLRGRGRARVGAVLAQRGQQLRVSRRGLAAIDGRLQRSGVSLARDRRDLARCFGARVSQAAAREHVLVEKLRALSPRQTLARGYAIVRGAGEGAVLRDAAAVSAGQGVTIALARGSLGATVDEVHAGD